MQKFVFMGTSELIAFLNSNSTSVPTKLLGNYYIHMYHVCVCVCAMFIRGSLLPHGNGLVALCVQCVWQTSDPGTVIQHAV